MSDAEIARAVQGTRAGSSVDQINVSLNPAFEQLVGIKLSTKEKGWKKDRTQDLRQGAEVRNTNDYQLLWQEGRKALTKPSIARTFKHVRRSRW